MKVQGIVGIDVRNWPTIKVIPGLPAANAGLQSGDVIIRVDEKDVSYITTPGDAFKVLRGPAGEILSITVKRNERTFDFDVERVPQPK
jgi:C-terminal processing protease CtpA/Prc